MVQNSESMKIFKTHKCNKYSKVRNHAKKDNKTEKMNLYIFQQNENRQQQKKIYENRGRRMWFKSSFTYLG